MVTQQEVTSEELGADEALEVTTHDRPFRPASGPHTLSALVCFGLHQHVRISRFGPSLLRVQLASSDFPHQHRQSQLVGDVWTTTPLFLHAAVEVHADAHEWSSVEGSRCNYHSPSRMNWCSGFVALGGVGRRC